MMIEMNSVNKKQIIQAAVMFTDISNYTSIAERHQPIEVMHFLEQFYNQFGIIVHKNRGKIIDYYGDGVLTVFTNDENYFGVDNAIKSAIEIFNDIKNLGAILSGHVFEKLEIKSGIDYGEVAIGTIGYEHAQKFAVVGDVVNAACRIEQKNKKYKTNILLSKEALAQVIIPIKTGIKVDEKLNGKIYLKTIFEIVND